MCVSPFFLLVHEVEQNRMWFTILQVSNVPTPKNFREWWHSLMGLGLSEIHRAEKTRQLRISTFDDYQTSLVKTTSTLNAQAYQLEIICYYIISLFIYFPWKPKEVLSDFPVKAKNGSNNRFAPSCKWNAKKYWWTKSTSSHVVSGCSYIILLGTKYCSHIQQPVAAAMPAD